MPQKFADYILTGVRTCRICGDSKPIAKFSRQWRRADPLTDQRKSKCRTCEIRNGNRGKLHRALIDALGGRCDCCGEAAREFLTVDHIGNTGAAHRRECGGTRRTMVAIMKEGAPRNKYRVLCQNCNSSLGHHGYCPHNPEVRYPVMRKGKEVRQAKPAHEQSRSPDPSAESPVTAKKRSGRGGIPAVVPSTTASGVWAIRRSSARTQSVGNHDLSAVNNADVAANFGAGQVSREP